VSLEKSVAILLAGLSLTAYGAESATKKSLANRVATQPDIQFLEYLGSLEGDDENWTEIAKGVELKSAINGAAESERAQVSNQTQAPAEAAAKRAESKR
jgi:hypothetical protein